VQIDAVDSPKFIKLLGQILGDNPPAGSFPREELPEKTLNAAALLPHSIERIPEEIL
jgi:hypothetical protein